MSTHRQVSAIHHPKASSSGCVYEHILVAEKALGRYLPDGAEVHHIDGNPRNNVTRNLVICQDKAYHKMLHSRERIVRMGGDPDTQKFCPACDRATARSVQSVIGQSQQRSYEPMPCVHERLRQVLYSTI